jgi:predicted flap endonuclease-1-like 5' DNA nuclease
MVEPIVGAAVVTAGTVAVAAYANYRSGSGEEDDETESRLDSATPKQMDDAGDIADTYDMEEDTVSDDVEQQADPTPDAVTEKSGLTDIKGIGPARAEDIGKAGFSDPEDIYYASDENLTDIKGIGPHAVEQMREDIGSVDADPSGGSSDSTDDESSSEEPTEPSSADATDGAGASSVDPSANPAY